MEELDPLLLSESERQILELYDRLQELNLELSLLRAAGERLSRHDGTGAQDTEKSVLDAQDRLLEARATYSLRNNVIDNVMFVNPVLRAVHNGTQASPIERDLLPYIERRDRISTEALNQISSRDDIMERQSQVEMQATRTSCENVDLASELIDQAARANQSPQRLDDDSQMKETLERLEKEVKSSRQRWKIIKGTASAVVVGSGVDWVRDERLRDMVLDTD